MNIQERIAEYSATPQRRRTLKFIGVIFVLFAALLAVMFYVKATSTSWPAADSPPFEFGSLLMIFAMAMSAICASVTMAVGGNSAAHRQIKGRVCGKG